MDVVAQAWLYGILGLLALILALVALNVVLALRLWAHEREAGARLLPSLVALRQRGHRRRGRRGWPPP